MYSCVLLSQSHVICDDIWLDMIYRYQVFFDFLSFCFDVIFYSYEIGVQGFERLRSAVVFFLM